jgi:hypothetical protein
MQRSLQAKEGDRLLGQIERQRRYLMAAYNESATEVVINRDDARNISHVMTGWFRDGVPNPQEVERRILSSECFLFGIPLCAPVWHTDEPVVVGKKRVIRFSDVQIERAIAGRQYVDDQPASVEEPWQPESGLPRRGGLAVRLGDTFGRVIGRFIGGGR